MAIDFSFTPDQVHLRDSARQFLAQRCPTSVVRHLETTDAGYDAAVWREMADLGWLGTTVPERHGGAGAEFLTLVPLYEEMGRALLPSPHLDTTVATDLLVSAGTDAQRSELLPPILAGDSVVSMALVDTDGGIAPESIAVRASTDGNGWILQGTKLLVAYAASATWLVCSAATDAGVTLFLVDGASPGVDIAPMPNLSGVPLSAVALDGVRVPPEAVVGSPGQGWPPLSDAIAKGAVLLGATIVGAARAVLDMTNQYAKDREQFGNPIGRYQAVQYLVSDILIDLHRADLLTRQAAFLISAGKPFRREAAIAAAFAKQASAHLHRQAHEVHAGVGFMMEHDLQLYSRRAKYWETALGDAGYHEARLVDELAAV
ncbi:MAG: acyl-CoA dehydrogenase family protein [Acidimicrobiia bacterium]